MTTYSAIPDSDIDPESPITTGLMTLLRDNPIAIAEGASGAPPVKGVAGGGLVLLDQKVASSSSSLNFTGIDSTYDEYLFVIAAIKPVSDNVGFNVRVSTDGGSSFISTGVYNYFGTTVNGVPTQAAYGGSAASSISISGGLGLDNIAAGSYDGEVRLFNPSSATLYKNLSVHSIATIQSNVSYSIVGGGVFTTEASDVDAIRFLMGSGNIASGSIRMYGVRKA